MAADPVALDPSATEPLPPAEPLAPADPPPPRRQPWRSLRVRITLAATAAFIVVFAVASIGLLRLVSNALEDELAAAGQRAIRCVTNEVSTGVDPETAVRQTCRFEGDLQVRDDEGNIVAGQQYLSTGPDGATGAVGAVGEGTPAATPPPKVDQEAGGGVGAGGETAAPPPGEAILVEGTTGSPDGPLTLIARQPLANVRHTVETLGRLLFLFVPLLAAGVAAIVWLVVDRALRPVDRMRSEVDQISHSTISRRLPEPGSATEIDKLARTMNQMFDRLESSTIKQRQFVADAGHELKTPLATLRTTVEVARRQPDPDWTDVTDRVLASERRLERLVDDLLTLARFDEDAPSTTERRAVDLEELVIAWSAATTVDDHIDLDLADVVAGRVHGDERELRRLVGNILDNAVQHATSRVIVALATAGGTVVLRVDDDGPGVPPDERAAIFDRFARIDEARRRPPGDLDRHAGTGLGLAIAQAGAIRHGGSITVEDSPLGGARFVVQLEAAP